MTHVERLGWIIDSLGGIASGPAETTRSRWRAVSANDVLSPRTISLRSDDTDARPARCLTEFEASIDLRIGRRFPFDISG
jgi:hypothetical protein